MKRMLSPPILRDAETEPNETRAAEQRVRRLRRFKEMEIRLTLSAVLTIVARQWSPQTG
jgi:hypothetical protein